LYNKFDTCNIEIIRRLERENLTHIYLEKRMAPPPVLPPRVEVVVVG